MVQINRQISKIENLNKIQMNRQIYWVDILTKSRQIDRKKNHVILGFLKSNSLEKIYQPFNLS